MKILLVCNMNNNFFNFARHLRARGFDADLALLNGEEQPHFHPSCDSYDDEFSEFVFEVNWYNNKTFSLGNQQYIHIKKLREKYDIIIGCGYSAMCFARYGFKLDLFIPYGSDLYQAPFFAKSYGVFALFTKLDFIFKRFSNRPFCFKFLSALKLKYLARLYLLYCKAHYQAEGIKSSRFIVSMAVSDNFSDCVDKLQITDKIKNIPLPMLYPQSKKSAETNSLALKLMQKISNEFEIVIFHHTRHSWSTSPNKMSNKRNDLLFKGVAACLQKTHDKSICVVTLEYGPDVNASKNLIKKLGIEGNVFWLESMQRKDILPLLEHADIGAVDFGMSWVQGGVLYEYLQSGLTVMQVREDSAHKLAFESLYPCINVRSESEVCDALIKYLSEKDRLKEIGDASKNWFENSIIEEPLNKYKNLFRLLAESDLQI